MNTEPTINQVDKLDEALALLAAGLSLEEVLVEAGGDATWLRPMLSLAAEVDALKADIPVPAPQASLDRLLAHADSLAAPTSSPSPSRLSRAVPRPWFNFGRLLFNTGLSTAIAAVLLFSVCIFGSLLGGGMVLAAEGSLPGQPLYPVKRLGETIRLTLTQDTRQRQQLEETFNQRRVEEVNHLIEQRKAAPVRLIGRVEAISETWLTVDDLTIELAPETMINGELAVGAQVRLEGQTNAAGQLVATLITVLEPAPPTPTPIPHTSTPIPTATATPLPPTATPTAASQSTSDTIKFAPTATPKPAPVEVETNDNGAGSDNSGPGSNNSGPGNGDSPEDNSGPGSGLDENNTHIGDDNSGPGSNNDNSEDNSGPGSNNSGSGDNNNDRDDHSGSGGGGNRDDNSGKSGGKDDKGGDDD